jgi:hypothetical protein
LGSTAAAPILFRQFEHEQNPHDGREATVNPRRITEITYETTESFTIRRRAGSVQSACTQCGSVSEMVTLDEAAALFQIGVRAIFRDIESGRVHFLENAAGSVFVCLDSLKNACRLSAGNSHPQTNRIKEISR